MKIRPNVGALLAAGRAHEPRLEIGKPNFIRPLVRANRNGMATVIVGAINKDAAHAGGAHLSEGDFLRAGKGGHMPMIPPVAR